MGFALMPKNVPDAPAEGTPKKRAPRKLPTAELAPDDLRAIFGQNLKAARLKRGMTQMELAEAADMADSYLSEIERGKINITLDTMKKLAQVVGHDVSGLIQLAQSDEGTPPPPSQKKGA